jgi:membrane protein
VVLSVSASLLKSQGEEPIMQFIDSLVERMTPDAAPAPAPAPALAPPQNAGTAATPATAIALETGTPAPLVRATPGGKLLDPAEYAKRRAEFARQIKDFIGNVRSGSLGVGGMVGLLFVAISMLSRIENTLNDIWGVARGRTWFARIVHYWAAMTLGPLLLAVTVALTSGPYFAATQKVVASMGVLGAVAARAGVAVLPYVIWSVAFALFYALMPNTRVRWSAAFVGGLVGGSLWQLNSEFSVLYVSRVVTNSTIYGSLGMIPVFMIGLYLAWLILLLGAQVAYAYQNRHAYLQEKQTEAVSQRSREFAALRLMTAIASRFQQGATPPNLTVLANSVGVPGRLARQVLQVLAEARLVAEVTHGDAAYVPGRPLAQLTAHDILQAVRAGQAPDLTTRTDEACELVRQEFDRIATAERGIAQTVTLQSLADRLQPRG